MARRRSAVLGPGLGGGKSSGSAGSRVRCLASPPSSSERPASPEGGAGQHCQAPLNTANTLHALPTPGRPPLPPPPAARTCRAYARSSSQGQESQKLRKSSCGGSSTRGWVWAHVCVLLWACALAAHAVAPSPQQRPVPAAEPPRTALQRRPASFNRSPSAPHPHPHAHPSLLPLLPGAPGPLVHPPYLPLPTAHGAPPGTRSAGRTPCSGGPPPQAASAPGCCPHPR